MPDAPTFWRCFADGLKRAFQRRHSLLKFPAAESGGEIWHGEPAVGEAETGSQLTQQGGRELAFPRFELAQRAFAKPRRSWYLLGELRHGEVPQRPCRTQTASEFFLLRQIFHKKVAPFPG